MALQKLLPDLYLYTDTCNVYVLKQGDAALLIDLGDGGVLEHLHEIGVTKVEWVLFTHHHREQCQGAAKLTGWQAKVAIPEAEKAFFETPLEFRKGAPTLNDPFSVYGASFVRPPSVPIKVDKTFQKMDDFTWRGLEFFCVDTRGNSPGGMSYLLKRREGWVAFTGDLMQEGARLHTWYDAEWDYGFAKGLYALYGSAAQIEGYNPALMCPSHGPVIKDAKQQLVEFRGKLKTLAKHYLRGYDVFTFAGADQDQLSRPTAVPHVWQVTPHIYKFRGPDYWPNFSLILADSGHALVVDCGLFQKEFLDKSLKLMQERLGLKQIDAVVVTHMHGDHCQEAPHLRETWGAKLWTMDRVVDLCRHPERYDYSAPINTYQKGFDSITFDRVLLDGETFYWEGLALTVDWMPGQTEFALCLHGRIDGRLIAFTGDNIFGSTTDPGQTGHEAVVARNSCMVEEGYLYAANFLHALQPDLILGGHSWVLDQPKEMIERYRQGALALRTAFQSLSADADYRTMFDPYWVRAFPYRVVVEPGQSAQFQILVRNFHDHPQQHKVELQIPAGWKAEPSLLEDTLPADTTRSYPVKIFAPAEAKAGVQLAPLDITLDGKRLGELFDVLLHVGPIPSQQPVGPADGEKKGY